MIIIIFPPPRFTRNFHSVRLGFSLAQGMFFEPEASISTLEARLLRVRKGVIPLLDRIDQLD